MSTDAYEVFKAIYCAFLMIAGIALLGVLTAALPYVALAVVIGAMLAGGIYIIRREGWLSREDRE